MGRGSGAQSNSPLSLRCRSSSGSAISSLSGIFKRPICFVGALGRTLNVQGVRLACGPRAPPCRWTLLIALVRAFLRQAPRVPEREGRVSMPQTKSLIVVAAGSILAVLLGAGAWAGPVDHPGYAKALTCTACHGPAGNSRSDAMPILAGMSTAYFKKQIEAYASGKRISPEMEPYAKMVLELGVDDVARYFADQKMQPTPIGAPADAVGRGRAVAVQCT